MEKIRDKNMVFRPMISHWATYAQWAAIITMTIDHVVKYLISSDDYLWLSDTAGRVAFPLFAGMLVWHWAFNTRDREAYANRVLIIGIAAQIPYMFVFSRLTLNVCFTLGLAMYALNWVACDKAYWRQRIVRWATYVLIFTAALLVGSRLEYGVIGVFYIMALGLYFNGWRGEGTIDKPKPSQSVATWTIISLLTAAMLNHSDLTNAVSFGVTIALL